MASIGSRIETVRVYRRGATVRRRLELGGDPPGEIEVADLPLALWDATVRVRVVSLDGGSGSDVVASSVRIGLWAPPRAEPPPAPEAAEIRALEVAIARDEASQQALRVELNLLGSIAIPERPQPEAGRPPPRSPLAARLALEELVHDGVRTRTEAIDALERGLRIHREKLADAQQRRLRASTARLVAPGELRKTVIIGLAWSGPPVRGAVLELEYYVPGARWSPAYQCRLSRDGKQTSLTLRALVCQRSGEDWSAAKLELSTAAPLRWTELPELSAVRIGKAQAAPPAPRGFRPPPQGAAALLDDYDRDVVRLPRPSAEPQRASLMLSPPSFESVPVFGGGGRGGAALGMAHDAPSESWSEQEDGTREVASMPVMASMPLRSPPAPPAAAGPPSRATAAAPRSVAKMAKSARAEEAASRGESSKKRRVADKEERYDDADDSSLSEGGGVPVFEAFVFTSLRLRAPGYGDPGQLVPADPLAKYLEILARTGQISSVEARQALERAASIAESTASIALPRGAHAVDDDRSAFDYAYRTEAPVDVPSDGAFHSVPVTVQPLTSDVAYVVVPREDPSVFRVATLEHRGSTPFLAGPVEVYVGDEYVLTTELPHVPGGGRFQLGLGVEQAIKCARNTRYAESRSGDKVVATHELVHTIEIELANNLDREIRCEVRERIPQPAREAEVVVEEGAVTPPWRAYSQVERGYPLAGGRHWVVPVPARGKTTLSAQYVVKIYANNEIAGGNRREA